MDERRQSATKLRILDTAERLFAAGGVHSTSLRGLTAEAKVNLAAVNYHFGSKEALRRPSLNDAFRDLHSLTRKCHATSVCLHVRLDSGFPHRRSGISLHRNSFSDGAARSGFWGHVEGIPGELTRRAFMGD